MSSTRSSGNRKKVRLSDALNAQLGGEDMYGDVGFREQEDIFAPQVDDFDERYGRANSDDELDMDEPTKKKRRSEGQSTASSGSKKKHVKNQLRTRGPLDPALSSGAYDAVPISMLDAEAAADDIFGLLDETEFDAAAEKDIDDEDAYYEWLESAKKKKRRSTASSKTKAAGKRRSTAADGDADSEVGDGDEQNDPTGLADVVPATAEDEDILEQLMELRARQMAVVSGDSTAADGADGSVPESKQAAIEITKSAVECYTALLRLRVKLQPVVCKMIQFPQYYALPSFLKHNPSISEDSSQMSATLRHVYDELAQLSRRSFIADENVKTADHPDGVRSAQYASLAKFHTAVVERANETINYWSSRVVQTNAAKLKVVNQPLVDQIRAIINAKARLIGRVQRNRLHARIYGHPEHVKMTTAADRANAIAAGDFDDEIFDDGDFVRELVHRSGAAAQKLEAALKESDGDVIKSLDPAAAALRTSSSKIGFHRKTKGKSVNYDPRPKLVGFMMRTPYEQSNQEHFEALLKSLFQ